MSNNDLNWIANFIRGIADDVLRDICVRGKYRVILPMVADILALEKETGRLLGEIVGSAQA
jgi:type I restriction enzyme M protein